MEQILKASQFDFISDEDKAFIVAFSSALKTMGYDFDREIGSGYCWGRYMILYRRENVKSKKVYARFYMRDSGIVLRLYFSEINRHADYIEKAPTFIREVFTGEYGRCTHCHNEKEGQCKFRKSYQIAGQAIEKCNGRTFEFYHMTLERLPEILALFKIFYPVKKAKYVL